MKPGVNVTVSPYNSCGVCSACLRNRPNACRNNETLGVQRDGAMQQWFRIPWQKVFVAPGLSITELALVEPLAVGFHAVNRGRAEAGDHVAVIGCGTVGLAAISAASQRGATVTGIDLDERKLEIAKAAGATHTIHSGQQDLHRRLQEITDGQGPDLTIEAVGTPGTFRAAVEEAAYTGRVVYLGYSKDLVEYDSKQFVLKELDIMGSRNSLTEFPAVIETLRRKLFPLEAAVSATVSLAEAGATLKSWSDHPQQWTKILVQMN